jgi:transposase
VSLSTTALMRRRWREFFVELERPRNVRVWLATGHIDMRKGFASLSLQVQELLRRDPLDGHLCE